LKRFARVARRRARESWLTQPTEALAGRLAVAAVSAFTGEPGPDRFVAPTIEAARAFVTGTELQDAVDAEVGPLR